MTHRKNHYQINDQIVQYRYNTPIRKGVVVKGPMRAEGVDHYHVKWNWEHADYGTPEKFRQETELICDMKSTKYYYN